MIICIITNTLVINNIMDLKALFLPSQKAFSRLLLQRAINVTSVCSAMCKMLLAAGSDVEKRSPETLSTPLQYAAFQGHERIIQLLLSHKADVNSRSTTESTPLHLASQEGHLASVVTLLQAGADPLLSDYQGATPIHQAAQKNHHEVVRTLIKQDGYSPDQVRHTIL